MSLCHGPALSFKLQPVEPLCTFTQAEVLSLVCLLYGGRWVVLPRPLRLYINSPVRNSSLLTLLFQRRDRFRDTWQNVCSASIRTRNDCECGTSAACGRVHRSTGPAALSWMPAVNFDQCGVHFGDNDVPYMRSAFPSRVCLWLLSDSLLCGRSEGLHSHLPKLQERSWRSQTLLIFFFFISKRETTKTRKAMKTC